MASDTLTGGKFGGGRWTGGKFEFTAADNCENCAGNIGGGTLVLGSGGGGTAAAEAAAAATAAAVASDESRIEDGCKVVCESITLADGWFVCTACIEESGIGACDVIWI